MLPSIVGEAIGALLLAVTIVALATLLQRARRQRADAELAVAFEREIASDLLEQADALDRLVAAVADRRTTRRNECSTGSRGDAAAPAGGRGAGR